MSNDDVVDLSEALDEEDMPMCPICGNAILAHETAQVVIAHGTKALACLPCIRETRKDFGL